MAHKHLKSFLPSSTFQPKKFNRPPIFTYPSCVYLPTLSFPPIHTNQLDPSSPIIHSSIMTFPSVYFFFSLVFIKSKLCLCIFMPFSPFLLTFLPAWYVFPFILPYMLQHGCFAWFSWLYWLHSQLDDFIRLDVLEMYYYLSSWIDLLNIEMRDIIY